jgi:uncharacterized protein YcbX
MSGIVLTGIAIHPVKSTAIQRVASATVTRAGLADDRQWMIVDAGGVLVSAREDSRLFTLTATPQPHGIRLGAPGHGAVTVSVPDGPPRPVRLHRHDLVGVPADPAAQDLLRSVLRRDDVTLVHCPDPSARRLNPAHSQPGDHTAYADGYPVTIASMASLRRLNDWITETALERGEPAPEPLSMDRFRPNLTIDGDGDLTAYAEDDWIGVQIGSVRLRVAKPVERCVMTTIDPGTLEGGHEPIRTLARHRRWEGGTRFAVHLIPETTGEIHVGDPVVPVRREAI